MARGRARIALWLAFGLAFGLVDCQRPPPPSAREGDRNGDLSRVGGNPGNATAMSDAGATAPNASSPAPLSPLDPERVRRVVQAWNDALDKHDVDALRHVYAERVHLYGKDLARAAVLDEKRAALGRSPGFHQSIAGPIALSPSRGGAMEARFEKSSGEPPRVSTVHARLVLTPGDPGRPVIAEESDESSDGRKPEPVDRCKEVAARVVNALPQVERAMHAAQVAVDRADGAATVGGMMPVDDDDGFEAELGIHTGERFEPSVSYGVDRAGRLTVTVADEDVAPPPDAREAVKQACKR